MKENRANHSTMIDTLDELERLIANAQSGKAIENLLDINKYQKIEYQIDNQTSREITLISSRFKEINSKYNQGIINASDYTLEKNKANTALIQIIQNLKKQINLEASDQKKASSQKETSDKREASHTKYKKMLWAAGILIIALTTTVIYLIISNQNNNENKGIEKTVKTQEEYDEGKTKKIDSSQKQNIENANSSKIKQINNFKIEFKKCEQTSYNITCLFLITNLAKKSTDIEFYKNSRIFTNTPQEKSPFSIILGQAKSLNMTGRVRNNLISDTPINLTFKYDKMNLETEEIVTFEMNTSFGKLLFKNLPIAK